MLKKNNTILFILLIVSFSCQRDNPNQTQPDNTESDKVEVQSDESLVAEVKSEDVYDKLISTESKEEKKNLKTTVSEKKQVEERKKIIDKQISKSKVVAEYKDDCKAIYNKYAETINKYIASKDESTLDEILYFINDPVFESCRKNNDYKSKFDALDSKLQ